MAVFNSDVCPKCHDQLYVDVDSCGSYCTCLQCGYRRYLKLRRRSARNNDALSSVNSQLSLASIIRELSTDPAGAYAHM